MSPEFAKQIAYYEALAVQAEAMGLPAVIAAQHRALRPTPCSLRP